MKARKIALLSGIAVLLLIAIIQTIVGAKNPVKTITLEESPDEIIIEKNGSSIKLALDGSDWYVGDDDFKANSSDITNLVNFIKEIKVLDTVGKLSSDAYNERWDLNTDKAISVTANKNGKSIRQFKIGKASSTGSQTYINLENSKDVNLVNGNLNSLFSKSEDALKSKTVFSISEASVNSINVKLAKGSWAITKTAKPDSEITWEFSGSAAGKESDSSKVSSWIRQVINLSASSWIDDSRTLPANNEVSFEISGTEGKTSIDIFSEKDGDKTKYYAVSSATKHKFELSESNAKKYIKAFEDLVK